MLDYFYHASDEWRFIKDNSLDIFTAKDKLPHGIPKENDTPIKDLFAGYALHILLEGYPDEAYEWTPEMCIMRDRMLNAIIEDNKF